MSFFPEVPDVPNSWRSRSMPPGGRIRLVCQWLEYGIVPTEHDLDAEPFRAAAERSQPMWAS